MSELGKDRRPVSQDPRRSIVVLGGGPTGLEAALYARSLGYPVTVLERGRGAGTNVRRWGFVRMFTPWAMNVSPLGLSVLRREGLAVPADGVYPCGAELAEAYLLPLAAALGGSFRCGVEVLGVARTGLSKKDAIGGEERARAPFRILVRSAEGAEAELRSDIVIDATGVYDTPALLGDGGLPALGERALGDRIEYHLADIAGVERERFHGKTTLLVGAGYSAATSLLALAEVLPEAAGTRLVWARRTPAAAAPFAAVARDPLPLRDALVRDGNAIAASPPPGCRVLSGVTVDSIREEGEALSVRLRPARGSGAAETVRAHHVLANVGYRPDVNLFRELQVHQCYATEGPMHLAARLLAESGIGGDCLEQPSLGVDALKNPEPGFFILGNKSYGRRSDYLMRAGREQIRDLFRFLEGDASLDLYASELGAS